MTRKIKVMMMIMTVAMVKNKKWNLIIMMVMNL